jgi:hypothetical protein
MSAKVRAQDGAITIPLFRSRVSQCAGLLLGLGMAAGAWADQWVGPLAPTSVSAQNVGGIAMVYVNTTQAVQNPAGCTSPDGYFVADPVITNASLAVVEAAIIGGHNIEVYVSSTQCTQSRPTVTIVQLI